MRVRIRPLLAGELALSANERVIPMTVRTAESAR